MRFQTIGNEETNADRTKIEHCTAVKTASLHAKRHHFWCTAFDHTHQLCRTFGLGGCVHMHFVASTAFRHIERLVGLSDQ